MKKLADGTIIIDTKINADGINVGVNEINSACKRAAASANSLGQTMGKSFSSAASATSAAGNSAQTMGEKIKNAFRNLPATAQTVVDRIKKMASSTNAARGNISRMGTAASKASKSLGSMGKSASHASRSTSGLGGSLKMLLRYGLGIESIFMLVRKLRQALAEGLTNLSTYSAETNANLANLRASLATLKNSLATAFAPIINIIAPILTKLIDLLATATSYISMFFAVLSGKSTYTRAVAVQADYGAAMADTADGAAKAAKNTKKAADATKEAAEAANDYLSPLDEINRYTTEKAAASGGDGARGGAGGGGGGLGGGGGSGPLFEEVEIAPGMTEFVDRLKDVLSTIFEPFKNAWEAEGAATIAAAKYAFSSLVSLAAAVGRSLMEVWTNGTGEKTLTTMLRILQNIFILVGNLANRFTAAWTANNLGTQIIQNIWNLFNLVLDTIERMTRATAAWANTLDFTPLLSSINKLLQALQPLASTLLDAVAWAYENVMLPMAAWTINKAAPAVIDVLTSALSALEKILTPVFNGLKKVYDKLEPVILWIQNTALDILDGFKYAFDELAKVFEENAPEIEATIAAIGDALSLVWSIVKPILEAMKLDFSMKFRAIMDIISVLTDWLIGRIGSWAKFISGVFAGDWKRAWEGLTGVVEQNRKTLENIKSKILQNWSDMKNKSITLFGDLRSRVQQIFSDLKNGLRSPLNAIIGFLNKLNSGIVTGVNTAIRALNRLKINVPDWVPGIGGKSFGFNIPTLTAPKIPYLASGAVIPPRSEFMAVLGDQKSGTNIETPERLLRDLFRQEFASAMGGAGGRTYQFIAQIDGTTVFNKMISEAQLRRTSSGRNPFEL